MKQSRVKLTLVLGRAVPEVLGIISVIFFFFALRCVPALGCVSDKITHETHGESSRARFFLPRGALFLFWIYVA